MLRNRLVRRQTSRKKSSGAIATGAPTSMGGGVLSQCTTSTGPMDQPEEGGGRTMSKAVPLSCWHRLKGHSAGRLQ